MSVCVCSGGGGDAIHQHAAPPVALVVPVAPVVTLFLPRVPRFTAVATYFLAKQLKDSSAGLLAAAFIGMNAAVLRTDLAGTTRAHTMRFAA